MTNLWLLYGTTRVVSQNRRRDMIVDRSVCSNLDVVVPRCTGSVLGQHTRTKETSFGFGTRPGDNMLVRDSKLQGDFTSGK